MNDNKEGRKKKVDPELPDNLQNIRKRTKARIKVLKKMLSDLQKEDENKI